MSIKVTRNDFSTDEEFQEHQQRMQEMAASELLFNIQMLQSIRNKNTETPCQTFYKMRNSIPLSVFIKVYPFNELVECGSGFNLPELKKLETLYDTLDPEYKQIYVDSFNRLQRIIRQQQQTRSGEVWNARLMYHRGGGRKTTKKTLRRHKRSQSRSKKLRSKKTRSKSRSKK